MKLFLDLLPVVLFFVAYKLYDIYLATAVLMIACVVQAGVLYAWKRTLEKSTVITLLAVMVFGALTLALHDPVFIKWKPTLVNWVLALVFFLAPWVNGKLLVEAMFGGHLAMPRRKWKTLNLAWVLFFVVSGIANLAVAYGMSESAWVTFKLFGLTGMGIVFLVGQFYFLQPYIADPSDTPPPSQP